MADSYLLLLPTGPEGPYSVAELRDLVRRGKARQGDRLRHATLPNHCLVKELIPDAAALEKEVPPASERIRRKVSDRHRAVAQAISDRQPSASTSDGSPAAKPAPFAMPAPPPVAKPTVSREEQVQRIKQIASILVIVICGFILWQEIKPESYPQAPIHPFTATTWSAVKQTKEVDVRDLSLSFTDTKVTITCGGKTESYVYSDEARENGERYFSLDPVHPILGASFVLSTQDIQLRLISASGITVGLMPASTAH